MEKKGGKVNKNLAYHNVSFSLIFLLNLQCFCFPFLFNNGVYNGIRENQQQKKEQQHEKTSNGIRKNK